MGPEKSPSEEWNNDEQLRKSIEDLKNMSEQWSFERAKDREEEKSKVREKEDALKLEMAKQALSEMRKALAESGSSMKSVPGTGVFSGGTTAVFSEGDATPLMSTPHVKPKSKTKEEETFDVHQAIARNEKERRLLMYVNAKLLSHMERTQEYKTILGDPDGTWLQYLAQIEVFYPRSTVYKMMRIYRRLTEELKLDEGLYSDIPINRLFHILKIIDDKNYEEWFIKARLLTGQDWNIEVRSSKGLVTEEDEEHEHDWQKQEVCKMCGKKQNEHPKEEEGKEHEPEEEGTRPVI